MAAAPLTQADRPLVVTVQTMASAISCSLAPSVPAPLMWTAATGL